MIALCINQQPTHFNNVLSVYVADMWPAQNTQQQRDLTTVPGPSEVHRRRTHSN